MASNRRVPQPAITDISEAQGRSRNSRPRGTGASHVYDRLRESILSLNLSPGTLLDESELAEQFELSRSPVREALIRLSAEGLVKTLPNRSSIVAPFDIASVPTFLDALELVYRVTCRLAAVHCLDEEVEEIEEIERQLDQARKARRFSEQIALNREFHLSIAKAGGNEYFTNWLHQMLDQGQRLLRLSVYFDGEQTPSSALQPHVEIIEALKARDPDRAEQAGIRDANYLRDELLREFTDRHASKIILK